MSLASPVVVDLPQPDARDAVDSAALVVLVHEACAAAGGAIGFDAYMELALYAPGLGYYSAPRSRFGERGDFVTAPEISPRFGGCVARQAAQVLDALGGGAVIEVGAGSGALAASVLDGLDAAGHADVPYLILERSASARAFQKERLLPHGDRVRWLDDFPAAGFRGVVLANELLDAIPARRFQVQGGALLELGVTADRSGLGWCELQGGVSFPETFAELLPSLADGYRGEFGPARAAWIDEVASRLAAGVLLLFDYGYPRAELYHPQRVDGTLACHFRHRVHGDPFVWPGLQDISVHVDFTAIAEAAVARGLDVAGYTTQAHFLLDAGLLEGLDDPAMPDAERLPLVAQVQRLTLPAEMGEAVKVIALTRGVPEPLLGFVSRDLTHSL